MIRPPVWFRGTAEEWNEIPTGDREVVRMLKPAEREQECKRLLAVVRKQAYNPEKERASANDQKLSATATYEQEIHFAGIRNWTESVEGVSATRIRDCILFLLDVKKDPWYIANCNNRAFVERNVHKMDAATPEDYHYDPHAIFTTRARHIDGEQHPVIQTIIKRKPKDDAERKEIREKFGINDVTIPYLAKSDCQQCAGKGYVYVSEYPDDPLLNRIQESYWCKCIVE